MSLVTLACPTCGRQTAATVKLFGKTHCPACVPVPDETPHDFEPVDDSIKRARLAELLPFVNLVSGACCGDATDCGHACGIA